MRFQWDPERDPRGSRQERRAIHLGLAGDALRKYAQDWIVGIEDIAEFVSEQRANAVADGFTNLITPREEIYGVNDPAVADPLGIDRCERTNQDDEPGETDP